MLKTYLGDRQKDDRNKQNQQNNVERATSFRKFEPHSTTLTKHLSLLKREGKNGITKGHYSWELLVVKSHSITLGREWAQGPGLHASVTSSYSFCILILLNDQKHSFQLL